MYVLCCSLLSLKETITGIVGKSHLLNMLSFSCPEEQHWDSQLKRQVFGFFRLDFDRPLYTVEGGNLKANPQNPLFILASIMKTLQQLLVSRVFLIAWEMAHNH